MQLKLTASYVLTFLLLTLVMMELHEMVHIYVGRIICGCWGDRDFNVWSLCEGCKDHHRLWWMATLAGPLFSFTLMWLGAFWLRSRPTRQKAIGFAVIFSNIPFGRITTVMMGGGDEMVVIRNFFSDSYTRTQMILFGSLLVLMAGLPPIISAFQVLKNRKSLAYIAGFLTLPLLFLLLYTLMGLNTLLQSGFLSNTWIPGTPALITIHTTIAFVLLLLFRENLFAATVPGPST